ncbi:MAG: alkaline phosphatase D family protein [Rubricoccaceae bacterium]
MVLTLPLCPMRFRFAPVALAALLVSGCVPVLTTASSTPSGQMALERAVERGLVRAGLAEPAMGVAETPQRAGIVAGPMLADVTHRGIMVWVQTDAPAEVALSYVAVANDSTQLSGQPRVELAPVQTSAPANTGAIRIFGLEPGWTYTYSLTVDGQTLDLDVPTQFTTQSLWQWRTDPPEVTIAFGSCFYDNQPEYDRPGDPYGRSTDIFDAIVDRQPDAMLWLGDNLYLREVDWWSAQGIVDRYSYARQTDDLQRLLASTVHYATWDDHDYGPNDSDRSYVFKDDALATFRDFWPNPTYGVGGVPGVFTQFELADVEVFLLDNRYHRAPNRAPMEERTLLGEEQMQWLLDALTTSRAPFKLVAMGNQTLNPVEVFETYSNVAPDERDALLDAIHGRGIEGVVFLSGDRHHGELQRIDREGAYPFYDFTSSPLTAGPSTYPAREDSPEFASPTRVEGTLMAGVQNFGEITVTGARRDRTLIMRGFDLEGTLLWEHAVHQNDLRMPRDE